MRDGKIDCPCEPKIERSRIARSGRAESGALSLSNSLRADGMSMRRLIPLLILIPGMVRAAEPYADAKQMIARNCAACHTVPGVAGAKGAVGPSLKGVARRQIIAGKLANSPANMVRWLMHPQQIVPGNAMPELGLTQVQASKIAAYLYTLDKP